MPNWVTNRIAFSSKEAYELFKSKYVRKDPENPDVEAFDFNLLIPMPESLNVEEGSRTDNGIDIALLRMRRDGDPETATAIAAVAAYRDGDIIAKLFPQKPKTDADVDAIAADYASREELEKVLELGRRAVRNIIDYGCPSWYRWSISHWGTKWNSCRYEGDPFANVVWFETAWSCPEPIIRRLVAEMGKDAFLRIEWADEDIGHNVGEFLLGDEDVDVEAAFDDDESDEAMDRAIRLNGAEEYYERRDGHWVYRDEDAEGEEDEEGEGEIRKGAQA